ncbi:MAG: hypothetical protein KDJ65_36765 [Anaerolineae bacterium]|nr:hypothetical protein [Anaerolineae bacterium]
MSASAKIHLLIDHCDRHNLADQLLNLVKEDNPQKYAEFGPSLGPPNLSSRAAGPQRREDERREIERKLRTFYGPLQQRLNRTKTLAVIFRANRPLEFRTLTALLQGEKFTGNDAELVNEIIQLGQEVEELLINEGGTVDDPYLRDLLIKAGTHFRILRMAYDGKLKGEVDRFKEFVFPRELDQAVEDQRQRLKTRLNELVRG